MKFLIGTRIWASIGSIFLILIKQASLQNVGGTRQAESAAHNLSESGQKLMSVLEQYRI